MHSPSVALHFTVVSPLRLLVHYSMHPILVYHSQCRLLRSPYIWLVCRLLPCTQPGAFLDRFLMGSLLCFPCICSGFSSCVWSSVTPYVPCVSPRAFPRSFSHALPVHSLYVPLSRHNLTRSPMSSMWVHFCIRCGFPSALTCPLHLSLSFLSSISSYPFAPPPHSLPNLTKFHRRKRDKIYCQFCF